MADEKLTNFQKWRYYCDGLTSPDSFIDFGFYFMICASLQRRVWLPPAHKPTFPNLYIAFVADPGIGKGLVVTEVSKFLRHHKLVNPYENSQTTVNGSKTGNIESVERTMVEAAAHADFLSGKQEEDRMTHSQSKYGSLEKPLLIPMAADATSYEALVTAISRALRRKNYYEWDGTKQIPKIYTHSSVCFCLEELSSIFKKKSEDTIRFLQITFDCGDYKKDTKTQGVDKIQRCCVNLLGAATPDFMRKIFRDEVGDEGFKSRCIFIFEHKDRKTRAFIPELNVEQKQCEIDLLAHIKKLTELHGQITLEPDVVEFVEDWHQQSQIKRPNINEKLKHYYARKKVHVWKLACGVHFGESTEMSMGIEPFRKAIELVDGVEPRMHHALIIDSKNPYYRIGMKILKHLHEMEKGVTHRDLMIKFWEDLPGNTPKEGLDQCLEHYINAGRIVANCKNTPTTYHVVTEGESL